MTNNKKALGACDSKGLMTTNNITDFPTKDLALTVTKEEPRIDSRLLARHLGNQHQSLFTLLKNHRSDFEQLGLLRFQIDLIDSKGQPEKFTMLNEDQSLLALTYSRNTKRVRELKVKLVKAFGIARRAADMRKTEYLPAYHELHDQLHTLAASSSNERHIHINVNKLLNKFAGLESGQRTSAALPQQALLIVGQMVAMKVAKGAQDHHDGYQTIKATLQALTNVALLEVSQ